MEELKVHQQWAGMQKQTQNDSQKKRVQFIEECLEEFSTWGCIELDPLLL
jgi:acyl-CoA-binding protein